MCLQLSDEGEWVIAYGKHRAKSHWLKTNSNQCLAVSSSEAKDRGCAFQMSVFMIILLNFPFLFLSKVLKFTNQVLEKQF